MNTELGTLVVLCAIAAAVPFIVGLLRIRVAQVVLLLAFGVLFGPSMLGLIHVDSSITLLSEIGMGMLFFLAGYEIERRTVTGTGGKLAALGWGLSLLLASGLAWAMSLIGVIQDGQGFAIALTTTALGTLLPTLRDNGQLDTRFGQLFMGAGAWGEFGPIVAISVLLGTKSPIVGVIALIAFGIIAVIFLVLPGQLRTPAIDRVIAQGHTTSAQTAIRLVVLVLLALLFISSGLGIDAVLGAFVAGIIVKRFAGESDGAGIEHKMEVIAFGFFIPIFFIVSGANLDIKSIIENPLRLLAILVAMLAARGVPQYFLYRNELGSRHERAEFSLIVATALPLLVAITTIEVDAGEMRPENAAALVGAGALSVLLFPLTADLIRRRTTAQERAANTA